jgi:alkylation response protein AidB-like acyl-CoA dehydrogenase
MIQNLAREFARKEIAPNADYYDKKAEFPHEIQAKARELGLINVLIPEKYGGFGTLGSRYDNSNGRACLGMYRYYCRWDCNEYTYFSTDFNSRK